MNILSILLVILVKLPSESYVAFIFVNLSKLTNVKSSNTLSFGIAKVVMFILVLFMFASVLYGRDTSISFTSFFQSLEHVPAIDMSKVFSFTESLRIPLSDLPPFTKFWVGVFNSFVAPILSFLLFINVCIYQLLAFVGFFIYFCVYGVYVV